MKASTLLTKQHDEVKALFRQLEKGDRNISAILQQIADRLAAHMVIEQEIFYPAIMKAKADLVLESYEEHAVARFALKRLMKRSPSDRSFDAKVTTLRELIEHHVREEESELFPRAEKVLGDHSEQLAEQMRILFEHTVEAGYQSTVSRGGPAVTSARAPDIDHA